MALVRWLPRIWPWLLAVVLLGPALGPGQVLAYDMVFVPDLASRPDAWGLGSSLPRAVPSDALVALVDELVPGGLLQALVLLLALVLAGAGAARLVSSRSVVARLAASTLYVWNPFVAERLGIGHWPLLLTYAALPWLLVEARRRGRGDGSVGRVLLWTALGSLSPAGGVVSVVVAVGSVAAARGPARQVVLTALGGLVLNAPWIVAGALHGSVGRSDPVGAAVFAAHGEGLLPAPLAVLGLGGIWNSEVVPGSRTGWPAVVALLVVLVVCGVGVRTWWRHEARGLRVALPLLALLGLLVSLAGWAVPGAVAWLGAQVPGAGLLRDGTRWVALLAPLQASLFGLGVERVTRDVRPVALGLGLGTLLLLSPVALAPGLAAGLGGRLQPVDYPAEYAAARGALTEAVRARPDGGDVLLLPFSTYRAPSWNGGRRVLDPLGRYLGPDFLQADDLYVSGRLVAGEDPRAARVGALLAEGGSPEQLAVRLRAEGIGWVAYDREAAGLLEGAAPDLVPPASGDAGLVHTGELLTVWELPGGVAQDVDGVPAAPVVAAWVAAALVLAASGAGALRSRWCRRRSVHEVGAPGVIVTPDRWDQRP